MTPSKPLKVLLVAGSSAGSSVTHAVLAELASRLKAAGAETDLLDPAAQPLPLFNPQTSYRADYYPALQARVDAADVLVLATPDYHGCMSSILKNFLDHFWKEFAGRLFVPVVISHDRGLTVMDQLRTAARQCYAWALPYGVSIDPRADVKSEDALGESALQRLEILVGDIGSYGTLLADQRRKDLAGAHPGFMARLRPKS